MLNKSSWLKIIIGVVVVLVLGAAIGFLASKKLSGSFICPSNQSFLDEFQKKFQEKADSGAVPPMAMGLMSTTNSLWGKIVKVDSNSLTLKITNGYRGDNFADYVLNQPSFYEIKVGIDEDTQIVQTLPPKPEEMVAGKLAQEEKMELTDLKEGAYITVELAGMIDIAQTKEVNAVKIRLTLPMP